MEGFSKHLLSEFDDYNAQATARVIADTGDTSITSYTYYFPDIDPLYCWAREENIFTSLMTEEELATVVSKEDAVLAGMVIFEEI